MFYKDTYLMEKFFKWKKFTKFKKEIENCVHDMISSSENCVLISKSRISIMKCYIFILLRDDVNAI